MAEVREFVVENERRCDEQQVGSTVLVKKAVE